MSIDPLVVPITEFCTIWTPAEPNVSEKPLGALFEP